MPGQERKPTPNIPSCDMTPAWWTSRSFANAVVHLYELESWPIGVFEINPHPSTLREEGPSACETSVPGPIVYPSSDVKESNASSNLWCHVEDHAALYDSYLANMWYRIILGMLHSSGIIWSACLEHSSKRNLLLLAAGTQLKEPHPNNQYRQYR